MKTCSVGNDDCDRYFAKGYCKFHYLRVFHGRDPYSPKAVRPNYPASCTVEGCDRPHHSGGYCHTHGEQVRLRGHTWPINDKKGYKQLGHRVPVDCCLEDSCETPARHLGRCARHHQQRMQGVLLVDGDTRCVVGYCNGVQAKTGGLCYKHRAQARRFSLSNEQLADLYQREGHLCRICQDEFTTERLPHLDHDHSCCPQKGVSCGKCIRGLVCFRCNSGLGYFRDRTDLLGEAIRYLQDGHKAF